MQIKTGMNAGSIQPTRRREDTQTPPPPYNITL